MSKQTTVSISAHDDLQSIAYILGELTKNLKCVFEYEDVNDVVYICEIVEDILNGQQVASDITLNNEKQQVIITILP